MIGCNCDYYLTCGPQTQLTLSTGGTEDLPPQKNFKEYWGNVLDYTDHCGDVWFGRRDTKVSLTLNNINNTNHDSICNVTSCDTYLSRKTTCLEQRLGR